MSSFGAAFHRADDAAAWATELQLAVSSEPWPGGVELRLRIGLHTGETEEAANGYFGAAVNDGGSGSPPLATAAKPWCPRSPSHCWTAATSVISASTGSMVTPPSSTFSNSAPGSIRRCATEHDRRGNIPPRLGRLIGRDQDLDVIAGALAQSPVVTLGGAGRDRQDPARPGRGAAVRPRSVGRGLARST